MGYFVGLDVGGSHVYTALFNNCSEKPEMVSCHYADIDSSAGAVDIIQQFKTSILKVSGDVFTDQINGIGFSIPGPFNYESGICQIHGVGKYEALFGVNLRVALADVLSDFGLEPGQISFMNDAEAFLLGAVQVEGLSGHNITAFTLGTGFGSASLWDGELIAGFPGKGYLYNDPYLDSTAEEYLSTRWFLRQISNGDGLINSNLSGVKELAGMANDNPDIRALFQQFGKNLAGYTNLLTTGQQPDYLIIGGNIAKSRQLFGPSFTRHLNSKPVIKWMDDTSGLAARGAIVHYRTLEQERTVKSLKRKSASNVLPALKPVQTNGYDIYPAFSLKDGAINRGFDSLAEFISEQKDRTIVFDGNVGMDWNSVITDLSSVLRRKNTEYLFVDVSSALLSEEQIDKKVEDYLGGNDPVFGRLYEGDLADFFDQDMLELLKSSSEIRSILYGTGASLAWKDSPVIYIDIPKNEIQYRSRAGSICNIGKEEPEDSKTMYKRFYFVDWPVCNRHKQRLLPQICAIADGQRDGEIAWMKGDIFREGLKKMAKSPFRVRPWFEPGVWGGKWMQEHFEGLNPDAENFAWSFELIATENGIIFESEGKMLEIGFEWLMYHSNRFILGDDADIYGMYFPLRFDYLDTMEGGNLSLQCHPLTEYIQDHFGEMITQDETYYILEAKQDAKVYLGFQEGINADDFEAELNDSHKTGKTFDADAYVQSFPASKHDLFLIPAGTIHCSGKDSVVLEISNTPYIYTFKMYDWQRLDLDGKPRPINIDRAMDNLDFSRAGQLVFDELISKPNIISEGPDARVIELPTHEKHLYRVQRVEITNSVKVCTNGRFHVINLVEGSAVKIIASGMVTKLHYAETMIIPAATVEYEIVNKSNRKAGIVKAFMK